MKKVILLIIVGLILTLLTGCSGVFDLGGFVVPEIHKTEFMACIEQLYTPQKIANYMQENFTYEKHAFYAPSPYTLWLTKNGDCNDFSTFGVYAANYHGYETYQVRIFYKNFSGKHCLAIYKENGLYNFSDNQYYFPVNYDNIYDIVKLDSQWMYYCYGYIWSKYEIYDYNNNLIEEVNNERINN